MKKIGLFLSASASSGGMYQYSLSFLTALLGLPRDNFRLIVAYADPGWKSYLSASNVAHLPLHMDAFFNSVVKLWVACGWSFDYWYRWSPRFHPLVREVVRQNCDLWVFPRQDVWSSQFPVNSLAAIHDLMHRYETGFPEVGSFGRNAYRDNYIRQICGSARGILVDSELGKSHVLDSYEIALEKVYVLPYVPPRYIFNKHPVEDIHTKYGLPSKYLLYPAQFWRHKNHERLINALAKAKKELPDVRLVLVGSKKNEYPRLHHLVERLDLRNNVLFLDYVPDCDMPSLYRNARALMFPTFFGPTNIPPLEAFALGCPVAASNIYAMAEQLRDAALLFDPKSADEMVECIRSLWTDADLCQSLIARGRLKNAAWGQEQFDETVHAIVRRLVN